MLVHAKTNKDAAMEIHATSMKCAASEQRGYGANHRD
jgi:hypothetical protein